MASQSLKEYQRKRDFKKTREPSGRKSKGAGNSFVIQKHDASRLHFDLRLEMDGVLKSWAVPKGPSLDPGEKRLAVEVEDHPLDYGGFEGTIPKGQYGGGTVMLWDRGTYEAEGDALKAYKAGQIKVRFSGERMKGRWALVLMHTKDEERRNWLLIKETDDDVLAKGKKDLVDRYTTSVDSGRSMDEIAEGAPSQKADDITAGKKAKQPKTFKPQLATWVEEAPTGDDWLHEIKFDGYRLLAMVEGGKVRMVTRNNNDWTPRFRAIAKAIEAMGIDDAIIDGEVVVLGEGGISDFGKLQNAMREGEPAQLTYFVFDLPHCGGRDLTGEPLIRRKEILKDLIREGGPVRYSDHVIGSGKAFFEQACDTGLEGGISKRADSKYVQRRSRDWVKVKCSLRQEFVIGGYTEPGGSRTGFGSLVLGYHDEQGRLIYCGRVGTGFDEKLLKSLHAQLKKRERKTSPFDESPTGQEKRGVHYVSPDLMCEVEFLAWTHDNRLRQPVFKGLRSDKSPNEVKKEEAVSAKEKETKDKTILGIKITHPDRVIYGEAGITKRELAEYYRDIAEHLLPHVADRPLALVRCPQGQEKECFFQKNYSDSLPSALHSVDLGEAEGIGLSDAEGLVALAQFGVLEIHPWGSREADVEHPDRLVFDLDPGPGVDWKGVVQAANVTRSLLEQVGLESWVKTSGGKGLHVCVPIKPNLEWDKAKAFCRGIAEAMEKQHPDRYVAEMSKAKRKGKIFVDYLRNGRGATSVAAFSPRARDGAPVSTPMRWDEIERLDSANSYTIKTISRRLSQLKSDPWAGYQESQQDLAKILKG